MPGVDSFDPRRDIPSLKGKTILMTGGTSGLGHQSALDLARHNPSAIWITGRSAEKGVQIVNSLKQISPSVSMHFLEMDLSSKRSIGRAAQSFLEVAYRI
ncbi:alcohol dehydrogenase Bli-4, partial [Fusarium albosuccineum]